MRFGVREICNVVLKAKAAQKVGNRVFYKNEPVCYFDSLKTSSLEGAATTVYAQGGRGNTRLVAWEGERTVTFTMEDALISPESFMILSGAGLIEASASKPLYQHVYETTDDFVIIDGGNMSDFDGIDGIAAGDVVIFVENEPYLPADQKDNFAYIMITNNGEPVSEPYIPVHGLKTRLADNGKYFMVLKAAAVANYWTEGDSWSEGEGAHTYQATDINKIIPSSVLLVDYYTPKTGSARQIEITADKFGGNYYLEASTLFRDTNGVDMPAEFIIPNCKIQSNFTFSMASTGDPSTFTFTMDAFPDYTRFDKTKKVLAAIQIIDVAGSSDIHRHETDHEADHDVWFGGEVENGADTVKFSGADAITLPAQTATAQYGNKSIADIMSPDTKVEWTGTSGKVTGTLKYIKSWNELPTQQEDEKSGNYFVVDIDPKYKGKPFTYKRGGVIKGTAKEAGDDEMHWVLRITGHQSEKFTFESDKKVIAEFDFSEATLDPAT